MKALTLSNLLTVAMATLLTTSTAFANPKEERLQRYDSAEEKAAKAALIKDEVTINDAIRVKQTREYAKIYKTCIAGVWDIAQSVTSHKAKAQTKHSKRLSKLAQYNEDDLDAIHTAAVQHRKLAGSPNPTAGQRHSFVPHERAKFGIVVNNRDKAEIGRRMIQASEEEANYNINTVLPTYVELQQIAYKLGNAEQILTQYNLDTDCHGKAMQAFKMSLIN